MNRLKLDFSLETAEERKKFIDDYIVQFPDLTATEASTIADYLLWGKDANGVALGAGTGLKTRWTKSTPIESLEEVLENPALSNMQLYSLNDAVVLKENREVFSRDEARRQAPSFLLKTFEELWRKIDETELEINFFELRTGKRDKPPRSELLNRFTSEDIDLIRTHSQTITQYEYLKLRHKLRELRTEQFIIRDSYRSTLNITQSIYSPKDTTLVFDCDIEVLPLGLKEGAPGSVGQLIFEENFDPAALNDKQLRLISDLIWKKKEIDPSKTKVFDFRELEMVYQLYLFKEDFEDRAEQTKTDHIVENNVDSFLDTLKFYESIADLTDIQREILHLKEKKEKNTDIANYINGKYGKNYTANYISTIFKQKIIGKINEAVRIHQDSIENCFFPENFKKCTSCGKILLLDGRNWIKKSRSKDGFQNRCKRCERENRRRKKEQDMFGKITTEELLKKIVKLDTVEFLGVCKILGVKLYKGEPNPENPKDVEARDFADIWGELCDKVDGLNRTRRKNLNRLIKAATKKGD